MPAIAGFGQAANPVLVAETRGGIDESLHRGAFAIANAAGEVIASAGDIRRPIFPRSAIKLLQAIPLVESGAAELARLSDKRLSLACASHGSEAPHVAEVRDWLAAIGAEEGDLVCGPHVPTHAETYESMIRAGAGPTRAFNNCSGKHAGFLTLARHLGAPLKGYDELGHPVQRRIIGVLEEMARFPERDMIVGLDGCGAPNFALPLSALATAFARVADPSGLAPHRAGAIMRLRNAVRAEPFYVAGTGRLCTRIISATRDALVKVGAEGVYVAAMPTLGLGLALKIDDGERDAAEALLIALFVGLGLLAPDHALVEEFMTTPLVNTQGRVAGRRRVLEDRLAAALGNLRRPDTQK